MGKFEDAMATAIDTPAAMLKSRKWIKYVLLAPFILIILYYVREGFWALDFAAAHGCSVNEGGIYPCIVDGFDYGPEIADKFMIVTLMSFMAPLTVSPFLLLFVFITVDTFRYFRARKHRKANPE